MQDKAQHDMDGPIINITNSVIVLYSTELTEPGNVASFQSLYQAIKKINNFKIILHEENENVLFLFYVLYRICPHLNLTLNTYFANFISKVSQISILTWKYYIHINNI